jgi:transposase-like protein
MMNTQSPSPCPTTPPFCPNPHCEFHHPNPKTWQYVRDGAYRRTKPPYTVLRYRCRHCKRCFSDQTFTTTYWQKRPELLDLIQRHAVAGSANRQIARILRCSPATVDNHLARLGRHCLLFHRHMMRKASPFVDIAFDGLVTFEHSQFFPFEIIAAVDRTSSFIPHFAEAELRRSGRMTDLQRKVRQRLETAHGRPDTKAVLRAVIEVLSVTLEGAVKAHVWSDKHRTYPRAIARIRTCSIDHGTVDSRKARNRQNPLFEVNCLDLILRHCLKDHTRETIAFSKRRQHSIYRVAIMLVWRNYIKRRREKRCKQTPAMIIGLVDRPLTEEEVLRCRLFVTRIELPPLWRDYYWRRVRTRARSVNLGHDLVYAF